MRVWVCSVRVCRVCQAGGDIVGSRRTSLGVGRRGLRVPAPSRARPPPGRRDRLRRGRWPAEGAASRCRRAAEGACSAAGRQRPGQLCGVLRPRLAALPGAAAAASRAPGRGERGRAARGGRSEGAPWPRQAARSRRAEPRPPARHGRLPRARRRPGLGPDGAAGRQPRGPEQRLRVGLRLVQRLRARRGSRAGQGATAPQQAALPRAAALRAQVSAAAAAAGWARRQRADAAPGTGKASLGRLGTDPEWSSPPGTGGTGCLGLSPRRVIPHRPGTGSEWRSVPGHRQLRVPLWYRGRVSFQPAYREREAPEPLGTSG